MGTGEGAGMSAMVRDTTPGRGIEIRHCHEIADYERCMQIEREVWGGTELDQVPATIFVVADETGGQVLGAYDHDASLQMVGFTLAMAAHHGEQRYLHSHMTAVIPSYQNRGIGRLLKLFQRDDALRRGIKLVEWTFDPLEIRNAYFNLVRLGAVVRRFLPNVYGITSSPLHGGMPTDRLVAEWWLDSPRVNTAVTQGTVEAPADDKIVRIEVPREMATWRTTNRARATEVQTEIREEFQKWLDRGYAAVGIDVKEGSGSYILRPVSNPQGMEK